LRARREAFTIRLPTIVAVSKEAFSAIRGRLISRLGPIRDHGCRDLLVYCDSGRCHHIALYDPIQFSNIGENLPNVLIGYIPLT
jgi:hypothetical protein